MYKKNTRHDDLWAAVNQCCVVCVPKSVDGCLEYHHDIDLRMYNNINDNPVHMLAYHKTQNTPCRRSFRLCRQSGKTPCRSTSCSPRFFLHPADDLFDDTLQTFFDDTLQTIHPADLFSYILQTIIVLCADDPDFGVHRR